jgi:hypothetical protein
VSDMRTVVMHHAPCTVCRCGSVYITDTVATTPL